jgi:D-amino-acid dehydrogenase
VKADQHNAVVVGGGIIGTCCAIELQSAGYATVVLEPQAIGAGTAAGSAGYLADSDIFPLASPDTLRGLPKMLFDPDSPLALNASRIPSMLSWGARFAAASRSSAFEHGTHALAAINQFATDGLVSLAPVRAQGTI